MKKVIPEGSVLIPDQASKVFNGVLFDVYQWDQVLYDGSIKVFEMLKRTDTVSVIAVVKDKIVLLYEEQPNSGRHKSFPGGKVEPDDQSIIAAAQRETQEETGYSFKNWRLIKVSQPSVEIEWFVYLVLAWDMGQKVEATPDAGEKISVSLLDFSEIKDLIMKSDGHMRHYKDVFGPLEFLEGLMALPEYKGQVADR